MMTSIGAASPASAMGQAHEGRPAPPEPEPPRAELAPRIEPDTPVGPPPTFETSPLAYARAMQSWPGRALEPAPTPEAEAARSFMEKLGQDGARAGQPPGQADAAAAETPAMRGTEAMEKGQAPLPGPALAKSQAPGPKAARAYEGGAKVMPAGAALDITR